MQQAYVDLIERTPDFELCGTAESAEVALVELDEGGRGYGCALVVTDLSLPGINGIEFVRQLQALRPDLPTVVISGHDDPSVIRRAREAGAVAFLGKADLPARLVETLRRAVEAPSAALPIA